MSGKTGTAMITLTVSDGQANSSTTITVNVDGNGVGTVRCAHQARITRGAHAFARMLSIIMTWERQGKDFFTTTHQALIDACSQS